MIDEVLMAIVCFLGVNSMQCVVSRSSIEVVYRSLVGGTIEVVCITFLLQELGIKLSGLPKLVHDNISVFHIAYSPMQHARTIYIEIYCHFVRDALKTIVNLIS